MTRDQMAQLFDLQCRGALAAAFIHAGREPTEEQWDMLHGMREITLGDIGGIGFDTVFNFSLSFSEGRPMQDVTIEAAKEAGE